MSSDPTTIHHEIPELLILPASTVRESVHSATYAAVRMTAPLLASVYRPSRPRCLNQPPIWPLPWQALGVVSIFCRSLVPAAFYQWSPSVRESRAEYEDMLNLLLALITTFQFHTYLIRKKTPSIPPYQTTTLTLPPRNNQRAFHPDLTSSYQTSWHLSTWGRSLASNTQPAAPPAIGNTNRYTQTSSGTPFSQEQSICTYDPPRTGLAPRGILDAETYPSPPLPSVSYAPSAPRRLTQIPSPPSPSHRPASFVSAGTATIVISSPHHKHSSND